MTVSIENGDIENRTMLRWKIAKVAALSIEEPRKESFQKMDSKKMKEFWRRKKGHQQTR